MGRKFNVGDKARIAPEPRPNIYPPGTRVGRIITIAEVRAGGHGKHCWYRTTGNAKGLGPRWYRANWLRTLDAPDLRGGKRSGAGRKRSEATDVPECSALAA